MEYGDVKECPLCHGTNIEVVEYPIANNGKQYRHQCKDCGHLDGQSIKHASIPFGIVPPLYDKEKLDFSIANYNAIKEDENRNFLTLNDYYKTEEWQIRRKHRLALNKLLFGGKCERCGKNEVYAVHHRSYRLLGGKEHAFDLECLCKECHALIHPHLGEDDID